MSTKKKILILQGELSAYNVPAFNVIAESFDLTVGFFLKDKSKSSCLFHKKAFESRHIGSLVFIKGLFDYVKAFDLVCFIPDMHIVSYCMLPFLNKSYKVVNWSIGFRVSYKHPYIIKRNHNFADMLFQTILSHCDASIFYMEKAKEFWKYTNLNLNKVFVAPNTTDVIPITIDNVKKKNFLFVGTLYKGKGVDILLDSYNKAVKNNGILNELHIVGDGEERDALEKFVSENGLKNRVYFHGAIYNEKILADCFSQALICISPTQGGLSVPKSMGYGVPFVTRRDAITGGEIYHITTNENGIMYDYNEELTGILIDASLHPNKYFEMGVRAKEYYDNNATIRHMAKGAMDAFNYAL